MAKVIFKWNKEIDTDEQTDVVAMLVDNGYAPSVLGDGTLTIKNLGNSIDDLRNLAKVLDIAGLELGVGYYNVVIHPKR